MRFWRIWIVTSVLWLMAVAGVAYETVTVPPAFDPQTCFAERQFKPDTDNSFDCFDAADAAEAQYRRSILRFLGLGIVPPLAVAVFWFVSVRRRKPA